MFKNGLVVAVKVDGKVLREDKEQVRLPYGEEYSLYIKNQHNTAAVVRVDIDGADVLQGRQLVVPANQSVELTRFLEGSDVEGHRFKFIQMSERIADHRGRKAEDGLIRVSWQFERIESVSLPFTHILSTPYPVYYPIHVEPWPWSSPYPPRIWYGSGTTSGTNYVVSSTAALGAAQLTYTSSTYPSGEDRGFTVKGSVSKQRLTEVPVGLLEPLVDSMTLQLVGETGGQQVKVAVTKKTKVKCTVCGTMNEGGANFCNHCGAAVT